MLETHHPVLKVSDSNKHSLITAGDSHTRGCASKIKDICSAPLIKFYFILFHCFIYFIYAASTVGNGWIRPSVGQT